MKELKKYYIKTYGCAMNYADSNRIKSILDGLSLKEVFDSADADLIVLNSCSVRKQAEDKIAGWGIEFKKKKKDKKILLTGCMAVRHRGHKEKYTKKLSKTFPWVDYIIDIRDIEEIPVVLGFERKKSELNEKDKARYLNILPDVQNEVVTNIPISTGCDFFCSYCIVPFSRGELLHREYEEILGEVSLNIKKGAKIICLVAQNVNSWVGMKKGKKIHFADLLNDIANLTGDFWITFISSNPMDFSEEMIATIKTHKKIMRWINIAVQSGSNKVLEKMNRRYCVEDFVCLIEKIKKEIPNIRLTTDIIVGFPTESPEDFESTLGLIKSLEFQMVYVGKYSPRELTLSSKMKDDVLFEEKKRRENILKDEVNKMRKVFHEQFVGKKIKVLVVGGRRGLSYYYHEVLFEEPLKKFEVGTFKDVLITGSTLSGLVAKVQGF